MDSREILRTAIKRSGAKIIAQKLGISPSLVYKWVEAENEINAGNSNPLERVAQLFEVSGEEDLIHWICQRADGFFVRNPPSTCKKGFEVMPATQEIVRQFAELLGSISTAAADNNISDKDADLIRDTWDDLKRHTEGFVKCCEEGDFANLQERLQSRRPTKPA